MMKRKHFFSLIPFGVLLLLVTANSNTASAQFSQIVEQTKSMVYGTTEILAPKSESKVPAVDFSQGPKPDWIWIGKGSGNESFLFRKNFETQDVKRASLICSCDNVWNIRVNGKRVAGGSEWQEASRTELTPHLKAGKNSLVIEAANQGGAAGLIAKLRLEKTDGSVKWISTDASWEYSKVSKTPEWNPGVTVIGKLGKGPWGNVFDKASSNLKGSTPRDVFNVREGFKVEKLFTVPKNELGSWVSICFDHKGRILASDQGGKGICRITPAAIDGSTETKVEPLELKMTGAQGMLYAFDALYFSVNGGPGSGFYRAKDTNGDDQFDKLEKLKAFRGGGEHGPHAVRLSPDGKSIYVIAGNHTDPPADFEWSRIAPNWSEDHLLPRQWDARGHARGKLAPGGWIAKTDPEGKRWEVVSMGYRNPYDMDFNADGDLFAYDADMEWDMGTPWYRPTRVVHATSGSEFGWRSGTGKWPTYFADSLPPICDIGPGSPVGAAFGYGAKFPAKYQKALFICDWTFGTMYAIHLTPTGSTYVGEKEEFVSRTPLPLTDVEIGPDGAMYFTIGGRGTQSELYRVVYVGKEKTDAVDLRNKEFKAERDLRRLTESSHDEDSTFEVLELVSLLSHEDRNIRYAARVGLERRPVNQWLAKVVDIKDPLGRIHGMLALAKQGKGEHFNAFVKAMDGIDVSTLTESETLDYLRTLSVGFIRLGQPNPSMKRVFAGKIDPLFPSKSDPLNRELSKVLVYLDSPQVIGKTLAIMKNPPKQSPQEMNELLARNAGYGGTIAKMLSNLPELQNIHYAMMLRNMRYGWTLEQRREYFAWLNKALEKTGGASYQGFIQNIRKEAMENLSESEKLALSSTEIAPPIEAVSLPKPLGPGKKWKLQPAVAVAGNASESPVTFEAGKRAYAAAKCIVCHRFDGNGGATGPDLTNVAGRFSRNDLLDSIINPDKVISDQYRAHIVQTVDGKLVTGRIVGETDDSVTIATDPEDATKLTKISKDDIEGQKTSPKSLMPSELLDELSEQELLDLTTYLMSRGNAADPAYQKK
ncbi:c-type cytochrome [Pirellulaceae bacterium]|nr:c-type cytochrome [Pirellulaceae bacterium]